MKRIIILLISFTYLTVNAQGIDFFKGSFDEAKALAKKENKIIFMDAYAAWCGPCKRMARDVFPKKEAGDYFNANFINVKMDMEKGEGKSLAKKYRVSSYPTLLFLDYNGDIVYQTKGARRDPAGLIAVGKKALKPSGSKLALLQKKFEAGDRNPIFLKEYITSYSAASKDYTNAFDAYLDLLSAEEIASDENKRFVFQYAANASSKAIELIKADKSSYKALIGNEIFDKKIKTIALNTASLASKSIDSEGLNASINLLKSLKPEGFKRQISFVQTKYYGTAKDWTNYDKAVTKYLKKYKKNDDVALKNVAWNYYMNIDDVKKLAKAEKWMQSAVKINNSYSNNLTQSYLLYKLKRYSEAQDAVEYALILAKESTKRTKNAEILKKKIEAALAGQKKEVVIDYNVK